MIRGVDINEDYESQISESSSVQELSWMFDREESIAHAEIHPMPADQERTSSSLADQTGLEDGLGKTKFSRLSSSRKQSGRGEKKRAIKAAPLESARESKESCEQTHHWPQKIQPTERSNPQAVHRVGKFEIVAQTSCAPASEFQRISLKMANVRNGVIIPGNMNGVLCTCTIDTGASMTVISRSLNSRLPNPHELKESSVCITPAGGPPLRVLGTRIVRLQIGTKEYLVRVSVADIRMECVLGMDVLEPWEAKIDLNEKEFVIRTKRRAPDNYSEINNTEFQVEGEALKAREFQRTTSSQANSSDLRRDFIRGDRVLLRVSGHSSSRGPVHPEHWEGPFEMLKKVAADVYRIRRGRRRIVVEASSLSPYPN